MNGHNGHNGGRGPSGERGPPGGRGPTGEPGTIDKEDLRNIVRSLIREEENSRSRSCTKGQSRSDPAPSCRSILDCSPMARSQYYWIETAKEGSSVSVPRLVYCNMEEDKCGVRGVMRVVNINMTNPEETCPSPLTLYMANRTRVCGSTNPCGKTCSSITFPTFNYQYSHVCGRAVGFSYHHPCAYYYNKHGSSSSRTLDGAYVSGLSITHGPPGVAPIYGHMLEASKKQHHMIVTAPVPSHLVHLLLPLLMSIITVRVLHSIPLLVHLAGIQTIPYGTMRTVIQEAIVVIPHVLLGL